MSARPHILIVTATAGYRHESIAAAERILASIAEERQVDVSYARDADQVRSRLTRTELETVTAVFFVNTTGELPATAAEAILAWIGEGGTFVGIHSASDTWHAVPAFIDMLGGEFAGHPPETNATVIVDDPNHPATSALPPAHELYEEFYYLAQVDATRVRPLLSLRVRPEPPHDAAYFPLAWEKRFEKGRVIYTALGHREDVWQSEWFRAHMTGILQWAVQPSTQPKRRSVQH